MLPLMIPGWVWTLASFSRFSFCALPAQSFRCRLFDVEPKSADGTWDENAIDIFKGLLRDMPLLRGTILTE